MKGRQTKIEIVSEMETEARCAETTKAHDRRRLIDIHCHHSLTLHPLTALPFSSYSEYQHVLRTNGSLASHELPKTLNGWMACRKAVAKLTNVTLAREIREQRSQGVPSVRVEAAVIGTRWDAATVEAVESAIGNVAAALLRYDVVRMAKVRVATVIRGIKEAVATCVEEGIGKRGGKAPRSLSIPLNGREKAAIKFMRQAAGHGFGGVQGRPYHCDASSGQLVMPSALRNLFPKMYKELNVAAAVEGQREPGTESSDECTDLDEEEGAAIMRRVLRNDRPTTIEAEADEDGGVESEAVEDQERGSGKGGDSSGVWKEALAAAFNAVTDQADVSIRSLRSTVENELRYDEGSIAAIPALREAFKAEVLRLVSTDNGTEAGAGRGTEVREVTSATCPATVSSGDSSDDDAPPLKEWIKTGALCHVYYDDDCGEGKEFLCEVAKVAKASFWVKYLADGATEQISWEEADTRCRRAKAGDVENSTGSSVAKAGGVHSGLIFWSQWEEEWLSDIQVANVARLASMPGYRYIGKRHWGENEDTLRGDCCHDTLSVDCCHGTLPSSPVVSRLLSYSPVFSPPVLSCPFPSSPVFSHYLHLPSILSLPFLRPLSFFLSLSLQARASISHLPHADRYSRQSL